MPDVIEDLRQFVRLRRRKAELDQRSTAVTEEMRQLEERLLDRFAEEGMRHISVEGTTVYLHRQVWARKKENVDTEEVCRALIDSGHDEMVRGTYSSQTVSGFVRDLEREGEPLPPELDAVLRIDEVFSLRTRASG